MREKELMIYKENYGSNQLIPAAAWELTANRTIYLAGEVTADMAMDFRKQLDFLAAQEEKDKPVQVIINSPGGSVTDGLAIYDAIQTYPEELDIICYGTAYSMAAILLAAGKKGHRFITPNSFVMIHEPRTQAGGGTVSSMEAQAELGKRMRGVVNEILAKHTGKTVEEIALATARDNFMTANEALEFGIVDEIIGEGG